MIKFFEKKKIKNIKKSWIENLYERYKQRRAAYYKFFCYTWNWPFTFNFINWSSLNEKWTSEMIKFDKNLVKKSNLTEITEILSTIFPKKHLFNRFLLQKRPPFSPMGSLFLKQNWQEFTKTQKKIIILEKIKHRKIFSIFHRQVPMLIIYMVGCILIGFLFSTYWSILTWIEFSFNFNNVWPWDINTSSIFSFNWRIHKINYTSISSNFLFIYLYLSIIGALGVVFIKTPMNALLSLMITILNGTFLLFLFQLEFLTITVLIVYLGGITVLFLFVIMLLAPEMKEESTNIFFNNSKKNSSLISIKLFFFLFSFIIPLFFFNKFYEYLLPLLPQPNSFKTNIWLPWLDITQIAISLYTDHAFLIILISFLLTLSVIIAIDIGIYKK